MGREETAMRHWFAAVAAEKRYIAMAVLVFVVSALTASFNAEGLMVTLKKAGVFDRLEEMSRSIQQHPTFLNAFLSIFVNNLLATLSMIAMGTFFGIIPLSSMLINGMMLGVVLMEAAERTGQHPLTIFAATVLPHGILELPAMFLAAAFGIRLGAAVFRRILAAFVPERLEASREEWIGIRQRLPVMLILLVTLLFVAAMVEAALIIGLKPLG
jgi:stage II sporulation protein M